MHDDPMGKRQVRYFDREWLWWAVRLVVVPVFAGLAVVLWSAGEDGAALMAAVYAGVSVVNTLTHRLAFRNGVLRGSTATLAMLRLASVASPAAFAAALETVEPWSTLDDIERAARGAVSGADGS